MADRNIARGFEEKSYSTLNHILRFVVLYINVLFSLLGLGILGFALYAIFAKWGGLDKGFFVGVGVVGVLLGFDIFLVSIVGYVGILFNEDYTGTFELLNTHASSHFKLLICCRSLESPAYISNL